MRQKQKQKEVYIEKEREKWREINLTAFQKIAFEVNDMDTSTVSCFCRGKPIHTKIMNPLLWAVERRSEVVHR